MPAPSRPSTHAALVGILMITAFTNTAAAVVVARARDRVAGELDPT